MTRLHNEELQAACKTMEHQFMLLANKIYKNTGFRVMLTYTLCNPYWQMVSWANWTDWISDEEAKKMIYKMNNLLKQIEPSLETLTEGSIE